LVHGNLPADTRSLLEPAVEPVGYSIASGSMKTRGDGGILGMREE
jgi:hypothetical protein